MSTLQNCIDNKKNIAIFWHDNPDGDAIGSMLGLGTLLESMGKKVSYFCSPKPSKIFDFLPKIKRISSQFDYKKKYDLIIFVDCSSYHRIIFTQGQKQYFDNKELLIIDHHREEKENLPYHATIIKDISADSNCDIIFEQTQHIRSDLYNDEIATYLYMGIATDTGNFHYDKDNGRSLSNAARLVQLWAKKSIITQKIFSEISLWQLEFFSIILSRLQRYNKIWYVRYSDEELNQNELDKEWTGNYIITMLQKIKGLSLLLIFKIKNSNTISISFRSKEETKAVSHKKDKEIQYKEWGINVAEVASLFWWWGHYHASWGKIIFKEGDNIQEVIENSVKKIISYLIHTKQLK